MVSLHFHNAGEGDLVLPPGDAVPGGNIVHRDHCHPFQLQLAGAGPAAGDGGGHRAFQNPHNVRAVVRKEGVALNGLLHVLVDEDVVYKKWLPGQFQFHIRSSPPL